MPMEREKHEALLNELLNTEIEHSRRTEILTELRADHSNSLSEMGELSQTKERLAKDNADLIVSNSKLFRQLGVVGTPEEKKEEEKDFSNTVTIESLEKGV